MTASPRTGPLRIGVVGLGDIAQKAYLPVLSARDDLELALMTRNPDRLDRLGRQYGVARRTTDLDDLLDVGIDAAFVHASTEAHAELVERLLEAGIPGLVDKPLAPDLATATHLVDTAERLGLSLAVGFNRRFAPAYAALAGLDPAVVVMEKNRTGLPGEPRRFAFDDFIHAVDTIRFLLPEGEEEVSVWCSVVDGLLATVTVGIRVDQSTGVGIMHRVSGGEEETLEVMGTGFKHRVEGLTEVETAEADHPTVTYRRGRGRWTQGSTGRGFSAVCGAVLSPVPSRAAPSPPDGPRRPARRASG